MIKTSNSPAVLAAKLGHLSRSLSHGQLIDSRMCPPAGSRAPERQLRWQAKVGDGEPAGSWPPSALMVVAVVLGLTASPAQQLAE
jgi:hypothetical protein